MSRPALNTRVALPQLLALATGLARGEIVVALREPNQRLRNLIHNRAAFLAEQAELDRLANEAAAVRAELEADPNWGMF